MKAKHLFLPIVSIIVMFALCSCSKAPDTEEIVNPFFFQNGEETLLYKSSIEVWSNVGWLECDVALQIIDLGKYQSGHLYNIKIDPNGSELGELLTANAYWDAIDYWTEHLNLGYLYVESDRIYKFSATDENIKIISRGKELPPDSLIVCQDEELPDLLDEDDEDWHHGVKVESDQRKFYYYYESTGTTYYEHITWERGVGLVYYNSGYGAEREKIELSIIRD